MKKVKRRLAAHRARVDAGRGPSARREKGGAPERRNWADQIPGGPPQPAWTDHFVKLLTPNIKQLKSKAGPSIKLVFCSDCAGRVMDMLTMRDIKRHISRLVGLDIILELHCYCDKDKSCRAFAAANHAPLHMADDIRSRNFTDGTYRCVTCEADHLWPDRVDVYVCCFPCGPWSTKGKRLGFGDDDGSVV